MYDYRKMTEDERKAVVKERLEKGYPAHSPPHPIQNQRFYLLTATCYEHKHHINTNARRKELLDAVFEGFTLKGHQIFAWVVIPNHYHLLVKVEKFKTFSLIFKNIHGPLSRKWNLEDEQPGRKVWYKFTDRAMRSDGHFYTTLNYIHYNPVKHKQATSPYDWPYSSVHWYREHYGRDWLRDLWVKYPVKGYGKNWDDI